MMRVTAAVLETARAHAADGYPHECCGVLVGRPASGTEGGGDVVYAVRLDNARREERGRRYLIPPDVVRRVEADATRCGLDIVGFYHSHPDHPAQPSVFDREHAWPWYTYLIVAVEDGVPGPARAWRLAEDRHGFEEQRIVIEDDAVSTRASGSG